MRRTSAFVGQGPTPRGATIAPTLGAQRMVRGFYVNGSDSGAVSTVIQVSPGVVIENSLLSH